MLDIVLNTPLLNVLEIKGTTAEQDSRFSDKDARLLKTMKFDPVLDKKVDMRKVNLGVMRPWVTKRVVELVGLEDEVVVEYAMELLEDKSNPVRVKLIHSLVYANGRLKLADSRWEKDADCSNRLPCRKGKFRTNTPLSMFVIIYFLTYFHKSLLVDF